MTQPLPKQHLISSRFKLAPAKPNKLLSEKQRIALDAFIEKVSDERYGFTGTLCPCGGDENDVIISEVDRYNLPLNSALCMTCGIIRFNPYLDAESITDFYRNLYQDLYARSLDAKSYFARQRDYGKKVLKLLLPSVAKNRPHVLEIGCGAGGGLSVFHESGCYVTGCDYSRDLIEYGKHRGVPNLHVGALEEIIQSLDRKQFDLVLMHHVFEHVNDPIGMLKAISQLIGEQGKLLVVVPDISRIHNHLFPAGDALGYLHIAHKYNYSPAGLAAAAREGGLSAKQIEPPSRMPTAWSHAPELWMTFTVTNEMSIAPSGNGGELLAYLLRTERLFRLGLCPAQLRQKFCQRPLLLLSKAARYLMPQPRK